MSAGRTINTLSQSWGTPHKYVNAVKEVFGGYIDLDPCSNEYSVVNAKTEYRLPRHDGLKESWKFPTIYVNPPYGIDKERGTTIKNWLEKCAFAYEQYKIEKNMIYFYGKKKRCLQLTNSELSVKQNCFRQAPKTAAYAVYFTLPSYLRFIR